MKLRCLERFDVSQTINDTAANPQIRGTLAKPTPALKSARA